MTARALKAKPVSATLRNAMLAKLHIARKQLGLDEDTYRDAIEQVTGKRSAGDCSAKQLEQLVYHFGSKGFRAVSKGTVTGPAAKYVAKITALWISGYNLGIVRDPSGRAMEAFIFRQTGIAKARWITKAGDAIAVIEGLKSWLERAGGVDWSRGEKDEPDWHKHAIVRVVEAQLAKLSKVNVLSIGGNPQGWPEGAPSAWTMADWQQLSRTLGGQVRAIQS